MLERGEAELPFGRTLAVWDAGQVKPLLRDVLTSMSYYWVTTQAEYATDLVFKSPQHLAEFFPRLLGHSTVYFSGRDVLSFLGRKWHGKFEGEVVISSTMGWSCRRRTEAPITPMPEGSDAPAARAGIFATNP